MANLKSVPTKQVVPALQQAAARSQPLLSVLLVTPGDIRRVRRELETVDDSLRQAGLRHGGKATKLPQTSRMLDTLASETGSNLLHVTDRTKLRTYLDELLLSAPVLHISFAGEPSAVFMTKLITWLRSNLHPQLLVLLGLQPSIAAGCIVRTANKQFDFSLMQAFEKQRELLVQSLQIEEKVITVADEPVVTA